MQVKINFNLSKRVVTIACLSIILISGSAYFLVKQNKKSPLPEDVKNHVSFKVMYPTSQDAKIDKNSFVYQAKQKVLTFNVDYASSKIAYSEQEAPEALGSDTQAYYPALGIHPYAQFKSDLGQVALTKFWQSKTLKSEGQSAVLASGGTFLIAHTENNLTNAEWKELFNSIKITK